MPGMRDKITRWTREGASLELIGDRIGELPASDEEQSALWLWAWSCRRPEQYRESGSKGAGRLTEGPSLAVPGRVFHTS
jgi:hypothetical protein